MCTKCRFGRSYEKWLLTKRRGYGQSQGHWLLGPPSDYSSITPRVYPIPFDSWSAAMAFILATDTRKAA